MSPWLCLAAMTIPLGVGVWRVAAAARGAAPFGIGQGDGTVVGGPCQWVDYNVHTHTGTAVPGLFREGSLELRSNAIHYNDLTQSAWTDGACSIADGPAAATALGAIADWTHRAITMNGGVHFTLAPSGGSQMNVSLNCPSLRYAATTRDISCSGGVQLTLSGSPNGRPLNANISAPTLQYQSATGAMECDGGVHLSLQTSSSGAGQATVTISCPTLHYAYNNGLVRCVGGVQLNLSTGGQRSVVSCPSVIYHSDSGLMECVGGVHFSLDTANAGEKPVALALLCPSLRFDSGTGVVQSEGGVSGQVMGISALPTSAVPSVALGPLGAPSISAPESEGESPIALRAAAMTYRSDSHVLVATGGVHLVQRDTSISCQSLTLDTARHTLQMTDDFQFQDGSGKHIQGTTAAEDLSRRFVTVTGPVSFTDAKGDSVQSQSATLDQNTRTATFSGNVHLADSRGVQLETTFVSIQSVTNGPERIRFGPLQFESKKSL